jgi:hypothetical protein
MVAIHEVPVVVDRWDASFADCTLSLLYCCHCVSKLHIPLLCGLSRSKFCPGMTGCCVCFDAFWGIVGWVVILHLEHVDNCVKMRGSRASLYGTVTYGGSTLAPCGSSLY